MNEAEIQDLLFVHLQGGAAFATNIKAVVPNTKVFAWESDMLLLKRDGSVVEFEIKTSLSDYTAEFKNKRKKHSRFKNCMGELPNYYYFVAPYDVAMKMDLPSYAGLMSISGGIISMIKIAPQIHSETARKSLEQKIITKLYYKYWNLRVYGAKVSSNWKNRKG